MGTPLHFAQSYLKNNKKIVNKEVSELGEEVADILTLAIDNLYNIRGAQKVDWSNKYYIEIVLDRELSTWDFSFLTNLVVLCHDRMIRMSVQGAAPGYLRLLFHKRKTRTGAINERLPYLEERIDDIRKKSEVFYGGNNILDGKCEKDEE